MELGPTRSGCAEGENVTDVVTTVVEEVTTVREDAPCESRSTPCETREPMGACAGRIAMREGENAWQEAVRRDARVGLIRGSYVESGRSTP